MPPFEKRKEPAVNVTTTPPETVGPVTVVTEEVVKTTLDEGQPSTVSEASRPLTQEEKMPRGLGTRRAEGTILVRGAGSDNRVVLWEKDERHPDGQAWVCNDGKEVEVFPTAEVKRKIKDGSILEVNWNS